MVHSAANLREEKKLTDVVRKYPCLYDKKTLEYKNKNLKEEAWRKIEEELQMEIGKNTIQQTILKFLNETHD